MDYESFFGSPLYIGVVIAIGIGVVSLNLWINKQEPVKARIYRAGYFGFLLGAFAVLALMSAMRGMIT